MIARLLMAVLVLLVLVSPVPAAEDTSQEDNAWYWYNNAVDLAYEGKFSEALAANEKALSINQSMPVAWANQAGILVQLGRYDEAIVAADTALSAGGTDMPNTYAAAWYSKGDALRALGRTQEAKDAYANAYALDNTLSPPDMSGDTPGTTPMHSPVTTPLIAGGPATAGSAVTGSPALPATSPRTPLSAAACIGAVILVFLAAAVYGKSRR